MTSNRTVRRPPPRAMRWRMPSRAILLVLLPVLMLTSCALGTRRTAEIPPALLALVTPVQPVGADLAAPCPQHLPAATDASLAGLGRNHLAVAALYHDCKDGKQRLADAARERERLELQRIERARQALEKLAK